MMKGQWSLMTVLVRAIGYGLIGALVGTPIGMMTSFLVGLGLGHPTQVLHDGALLGAVFGAMTGVLASDPVGNW